jgi:tryptophanyl-tRNA synthetase
MTAFSNKISKEDVFVAGARSTGNMHIGNYYGAVKNFVDLSSQIDNPMYFFIADWHSLTTHANPEELRKNNFITLCTYLGCGLDPERATIYFQSDVPAISELYLYLNMFAYMGELERTATFKEKIQKHANNINAGLLTYPVLMAADILIHKGTKVPVGKDQAQHVEMTRTFGNRFNHYYQNEVFKEAFAFTYTDNLISIPSLSGKGKMSKSDDENSAIMLMDSDEMITKKIKRAKTDTGPTEKNMPLSEELINLFKIMELFSEEAEILQFKEDYANASIRYGDLKSKIAADAVVKLAPIRENIESYIANPKRVYEIALSGAEKANQRAQNTIEEIRACMGLTSKTIKNLY